MKNILLSLACFFLLVFSTDAQSKNDPITWKGKTTIAGQNKYLVHLMAENKDGWELYAPDNNFEGIKSAEIHFTRFVHQNLFSRYKLLLKEKK